MELAEKQLQEFSDQGFVNVGRIFDERQLATISAEYDRLVTQAAQVLGPAPESLEQIRRSRPLFRPHRVAERIETYLSVAA